MHIFKLKQLAFALCLVTLPYSVLAAGLGKLNIMSSLGEPLKADIELLSVTPEELASISATIASNEAYENQGLEKPASHNDIKIDIAKNARGVPILKLKSTQPIVDPFLDMLIQVDWSSGRLLREYTLLLDPPGYSVDATSASSAVLPSAQVKTEKTEVVEAPKASKAVTSDQPKAQPLKKLESTESTITNEAPLEALPPAYDESQAYTTKRGDNLSKIAQELKPENVSLEQMLVGLFQANPDAFDGDNMNRLKAGKIIRAPSQEELDAIGHKSARKEVRVQTANWNAYKNKLAGIVEDSVPAEDSGSTQSSSGKVMAAEDKAMPASQEPRDVVKLSAGETAESAKALQDKLAALQEDSIAKENALKEAQAKSIQLEQQLEEMKKLLSLKSDAMAKMQSEANSQTQTEVVEGAKPEVTAEAAPAANSEEPPKPANPEPKPVVTPPAPPQPVEQPSFLTSVLDGMDTNTLGIAGGGLAVLAGGLLFLRNKRKKNLASFEEGIMTSGGLKANTVFGNTAGGTVDTGDTSFLTDFSQSTAGGMIDSHDVDPIAEAEVYMAYGRDAQAEEILKDAIVKEPTRYELHLKLLEIYQESGNTSAFEAISGELYTTLGASNPVWAQVAQLGIKMDPDNPLYQVSESDIENEGTAADALDDGLEATIDPLLADDVESTADLDNDIDGLGEFASDLSDADNGIDGQTIPATQPQENEFDMDFGTLEFDMDATEAPVEDAASTSNIQIAEDTLVEDDSIAMSTASEDSAQGADIKLTDEPVALTDGLSTASEDAEMSFNTEEPEANSLDVPTLDFPDIESFSTTSDDLTTSDKLSLDNGNSSPSDEPFADTLATDELSDSLDKKATALDFNLDENSDETDSIEGGSLDLSEAGNIDLSEISLDLDDSPMEDSGAETEVTSGADEVLSEPEPEEVETKLDLVMAYLDMEDKIGAKELLDEVMKEGGENQRKRATELLEKIA